MSSTLSPSSNCAFSLIAQASSESLDVFTILMGMFGGLALFLFGMDRMSESLKQVAGQGMKKVLSQLTTNRFTGALAGAIVTAVIQSSSVTTVLVVGFISAQLMNLTQSIGVIMGANIGTTITAQIIAFKVTKYALLMVAVGFGMSFLSKREKIRQYGDMIMGLGLIFFGMHLMSEGAHPLRSYQPFIDMMKQMDNPIYAIILSAVFTGIVQSSSATTGIVIVLASQGFITLEAGIALIFGANIGTCVTAILASIGKSREAVRASVVHVIFNVGGVLLWFYFIPYLAQACQLISPSSADLSGSNRLAAETPRQIANAHTIFNVSNTLIFIWFTRPIGWLVCRIVPDRVEKPQEVADPKYLDELLIRTPPLALDLVRMELGRMGAAALRMIRECLPSILHGSNEDLDELVKMDNDVDSLHESMIVYLGRLAKENLSSRQSEQLHDYISAANNLESIADIIESNLAELGRQRIQLGIEIGEQTKELLSEYHKKICWSAKHAIRALVEADKELAQSVLSEKQAINELVEKMERHIVGRLSAAAPNRLYNYRLETELIDYLKRVYYFSKRIAKVVIADDTHTQRQVTKKAK